MNEERHEAVVQAAVAAAKAAVRAQAAGFRPNVEVWKHPLNCPGVGTEDNLGNDGAVSPLLADHPDGTVVPGCECLVHNVSLQEFNELRHMGKVKDPLELFDSASPALSPLSSYGAMRISVLRALEIEWSAGPERPLAQAGQELGSGLLTYHPSLPQVLANRTSSTCLSGCNADRLLGLSKLYGAIDMRAAEDLVSNGPFSAFPAVDRTGTLTCGLRVTVVWPVPSFDPQFCQSLEAVMASRVAELRKKHARLHVLWSGGIDTTALLTAFLRELGTEPRAWEEAGVSVHYCRRSASENPRFFERFVRRLPGGTIEGHVRDFIDGERTVVTGEPADMLFGTTWLSRAFRFAATESGERNPTWYALEEPWQDVLPEVLRMHQLLPPGKEEEDAWLRWIYPFVRKSPIPVKTLFDFSWWVVFALKWQHDMVRSFLNRKHMSQQVWDSVEHFYCTEEWQQWCYHNHQRKMLDKSVWASYKQPLKKYILDYDGDTEYYACKIKVPSATYAFGYQWGLDDAFHSIEFGKLSVSRVRLHEKYGERLLRYLAPDEGQPAEQGDQTSPEEERSNARAKALGFLPNGEAQKHPMNCRPGEENQVEEDKRDDVLDPAVNSLQLSTLELAKQRVAELEGCPPGYEAVGTFTGLAEFLRLRRAGQVLDSLEIISVETPSTSTFRDYAELHVPLRSAIMLEWALGPERPLAEQDLGRGLLAYHPMLPYLLRNRAPSPDFSGCDEDRLLGLVRCIGQNAGGFPAVDRSGTFSCGLRVRSLFPLPAFEPAFQLNLGEVMARRVSELLQKHSRLHLLWSGGIDTTAVLVGFLRAVGTEPEQWRRAGLSVHYAARSVREHPTFFERFVQHLPGGVIEGSLREFIDGTRVIVAGTPADQLFSTAWFKRAFTQEKMRQSDGRLVRNPVWYALGQPWESVIPKQLRMHGCLAAGAAAEAAWLRWVRPWVAKAPIPVRNVFDFGWWVSVSLKWQYDCLRVFLNRPQSPEELRRAWGTVEHFYGTDEWQQWGYHNHSSKMRDLNVWASFKEPLKAYIRDFDGNAEYYQAKAKVASVRLLFGYQLGLTETFHSVSFGALSLSGKRMREKYGQRLSAFLDDCSG